MKLYYNNRHCEVLSLSELKTKTKNWKDGFSAASIGRFVLEHDGVARIEEIVNGILTTIKKNDNEDWASEEAIFEYESIFDNYRHGRMHDLALRDTKKRVFVGIEAKVNEPFDSRDIQTAYLSGLLRRVNGKNSDITNRIESLIRKNNFKKQNSKSSFAKNHLNLKYQLLFSTVGTAIEDAETCIYMVLVFKTKQYNEISGAQNYYDYQSFMESITSERINNVLDLRKLDVFIDDELKKQKTIYAAYCYVDARDWNN